MRELVRRHLGKVVAGVAVAAAGAALIVGTVLEASGGAGGSNGNRTAAVGSAQRDAIAPDGRVEAAPTEGRSGVGSDPLTDDEIKRAERLAVTSSLRASARDVEGDRGPQHLSTNLAEPDQAGAGASADRRAEVVYYDYKSDTVLTKTVDLTTGKVEHTDTARGVQPPPSPDEMREAAGLLIGDPLGADLKSDFRHATGKTLTGPGQLELSGMVFRKETVEHVPSGLTACGEHRCLRIVAKVKNGPWIDTRSMVVDLSARKVGRLG